MATFANQLIGKLKNELYLGTKTSTFRSYY